LEQQKPAVIAASTTSPANNTSSTVSPAQKVMVAPLSGSVTPGTKMVLATKVGSPATVTFQQNKNFHQTFATWVKQGQSNSGRARVNEWNIAFVLGGEKHFLTFIS
jgi:nucleosome-remodeling factor subunit BPTF